MSARARCALVCGALLLVLPASADAMIQVDRGIAGARLGNTRAEVRAALGTPSHITNGSNDFGPFTQFRYAGGLTVTFQGRTHVTSVSTTGRGDRTARGVGVGSSERTVRRRVAGVKCETIAGSRSCHTHTFDPGRRVTDFVIRHKRVTRVTVGVVVD
jgi:hypothetical protein